MNLRAIAADAIESVAQDFTSLKDHDLRYHDNNYRGGPCIVRDTMKSGDNSDQALPEANEREAALWVANRQERKIVEDAVIDGFDAINANNSRVMLSEADKDGVSKLTVWSKAKQVGDDAVPEDQLRSLLKGLGYTMLNYSLMIENGDNGMRKGARKCFVADVTKQNKIRLADKETDIQKIGHVRSVESEPMTDARKSALLRQFGVKSVGGKVVRRDAGDTRMDRAKRYLGIVGDWEGQSTREDAASGEWEKKRLQSLKKAQEDKLREASGV